MKLLCLTFAALALVLAACGDDDSETRERSSARGQEVFVGGVKGSRAYIALLSDGRRVSGYVCDGRRVSTWLRPSPLEGSKTELVSGQGVWLGEASLSAKGATGHVEIDGERHAFAARAATGEAGLYRAVHSETGEPGSIVAGWIVLPDGSLRGAKLTFIDQESDFVVAPAPGFSESGTDFVVDLGSGSGATRVVRLEPGFIETGADF
jgi:hypothetical protein